MIHMEEIPQTRQVQRSLPRPAVPIEVGSEEVPDDVTIETTELVFDQVPIDLPPPPISAHKSVHLGEEEEPLEIWQVQKKPELTNELILEYPNLAEKAGLEGTVDVKLLVGSDGRVKKATVLRGKEIFHKAHAEGRHAVCLQAGDPERQAGAGVGGCSHRVQAGEVAMRG